MERFQIEIGGGLGPWAGKAWRIGLMGEGSSPASLWQLLSALESLLSEAGHPVPGNPLAAAQAVLRAEGAFACGS